MECPSCGSEAIVKNGSIHNKKQKYACKECGRQFVEKPENKNQPVTPDKIELIEKLLLERLALAAIARVSGVSEKWLQNYVNKKYAETPREVKVRKKSKGRLTIECYEQWIWLALDVETREIVGVHVGRRDSEAALELWHSLPPAYRQCAVSYTDFWSAYQDIFPSTRHRAVGKETGLTNHIERFNCTMRQRISRLVRKALSFSKNLENHIGAIWNFVHHCNPSLLST